MRAIPPRAVDFVARFEGLRLESYVCPAGVLTAGYGHTGPEVHAGLRITQAKAKAWLADDLRTASAKIQAVVGREVIDALTEARWIALLSFAFNLGFNSQWQIAKLLKARQFDAVPGQLVRFVNAGGRKLQGLVNRRAAEVALWNEDADEDEVPSSITRSEPTPPTPEATKPMAQSRTAWTGGAIVTVAGVQAGAQQVQAIIAPQAEHAPWLGNLMGITAGLIVLGGVAILLIKWLERREAKR